MNIRYLFKTTLSIFTILFLNTAYAATIYPIDSAQILAGSKFDIKIEFNQVVNPGDIVIEINGAPISKWVANKSEFISNENSKGSSIIY